MKKHVPLIIRLFLTTGLITACLYIGYRLEYWSQLKAFDNLIGAAPLVILFGSTGFFGCSDLETPQESSLINHYSFNPGSSVDAFIHSRCYR